MHIANGPYLIPQTVENVDNMQAGKRCKAPFHNTDGIVVSSDLHGTSGGQTHFQHKFNNLIKRFIAIFLSKAVISDLIPDLINKILY